MVVSNAEQYTVTRVCIGIRTGRSRLRIKRVTGGYRLGGQTGAKGRDLILFGPVLTRAALMAEGQTLFGKRPVEWRQ